jgi:hypothetical protein
MPVFRVPVVETNYGVMLIEADTLEDVKQIIDNGDLYGDEEYMYFSDKVSFDTDKIELA